MKNEINLFLEGKRKWVWRFNEATHTLVEDGLRQVCAKNVVVSSFELVSDGLCFDESFVADDFSLDVAKSLLDCDVSGLPRISGRGLYLNRFKYRNYYHFLFDYIPRILLFVKLHGEPDYILTFKLNDWQRAVIESLGLSKYRFVSVDVLSVCDDLVFFNQSKPAQSLSLAFDFYKKVANHDGKLLKKLIYVRRAGTKNRSVTNEDVLLRLVESLGFEIVDPAGLSFAEQINLFSKAKLVAGFSGAAFSNAVFMREGGCVFDFFPKNSYDISFWSRFAEKVGVGYKGFPLDIAKVGRNKNLSDSEYRISNAALRDFEKAVKQVLKNK